MKLLSGKCHRTPLMISHHWFRLAWCHQATSHYLKQCWPRSKSQYGVNRPQWVKLPLKWSWRKFHTKLWISCVLNSMLVELISFSEKRPNLDDTWGMFQHKDDYQYRKSLIVTPNGIRKPQWVQHIEAETKLLPFRRRHFQMHFLE